jgi:hypothetical protein
VLDVTPNTSYHHYSFNDTSYHHYSFNGEWLYTKTNGGPNSAGFERWALDPAWDLSSASFDEYTPVTSASVLAMSQDGHHCVTSSGILSGYAPVSSYYLPNAFSLAGHQLISTGRFVLPGDSDDRVIQLSLNADNTKLYGVAYYLNDLIRWDLNDWDVENMTNHERYAVAGKDVISCIPNSDESQVLVGHFTGLYTYDISPPNSFTNPLQIGFTQITDTTLIQANLFKPPFGSQISLGTWSQLQMFDILCGWNFQNTNLWNIDGVDLRVVTDETGTVTSSMVYAESEELLVVSAQNGEVFTFNMSSGSPQGNVTPIASTTQFGAEPHYQMQFSHEGTRFYCQGYASEDEKIYHYELAAPYDLINPATLLETFTKADMPSDQFGNYGPRSFIIHPEGDRLWTFCWNSSQDRTYGYEYVMNTPWSFDSLTELGRDIVIHTDDDRDTFILNPAKSIMIGLHRNGSDNVVGWRLNTPGLLKDGVTADPAVTFAGPKSQIFSHCLSDAGDYWYGISPNSPYYMYRYKTDAGA